VQLEACESLLARGFVAAYLILDDHVPLGPCHTEHLNVTLPTHLDQLGATYIWLNGWGQGRPTGSGTVLRDRHRLERVGPDFTGKFSLHPGLWNLRGLRDLLRMAQHQSIHGSRAARRFEFLASRPDGALPTSVRGGSYRVHGRSLARPDTLATRARRDVRRQRLAAGLRHRLLQLTGRRTAAARYATQTRFLFRYYDGPYPLYWSGLLADGNLHRDCLRFLELIGRRELIEDLRRRCPPALATALDTAVARHAEAPPLEKNRQPAA
jgi:hypothetical protein